MPRFLHTADWQLGLSLGRLKDDRGARARNQRFETVQRIATLADEHAVDAVVVAGDVFDDNGVGPHHIQALRDALRTFTCPVLLLPGNHDPATADSALRRLAPAEHGLDHVHLLLTDAPVDIGDATYVPAPLFRRQSPRDPCAALPDRGDDTRVRVAIAHGAVHDFSQGTDPNHCIDLQAVLAKGFDFVALGDWHGLKTVDPRAAYSGTHEATKFSEKNPGQVLLVDIPEAGAVPHVEVLPVARTQWRTFEPRDLTSAADVDALLDELDRLEERSWTLVQLRLSGTLSLAERSRLVEALEVHEGELLHLDADLSEVRQELSDAELELLETPGFLGSTIEALKDLESPDADQALFTLVHLIRGAA